MNMRILLSAAVLVISALIACTDSKAKYIDLNTGQEILIEKDSVSGYALNGETHKPVRFYVNTVTKDTIDGRTGEVVRKTLVRRDNGIYIYADDVEVDVSANGSSADGELKIKDGDYKKKVDGDGSVKIKDGDTKIKIDENGNKKVKRDN
jgi:hypothetical protein